MRRPWFSLIVLLLVFGGVWKILPTHAGTTFATAVDYAAGNGARSVFAADFDGDGDLDLVVANGNVSTISVFINKGGGTYAAGVLYTVGNSPRGVMAADFDGDGDQDLAVANYGSVNISVLKNNGDGTFAAAVNYPGGGTPTTSLFVGDFDGDNDSDIAGTSYFNNRLFILKNNGNATFAAAVNYTPGAGPQAVYGADLDGDSDIDLAVANYTSDNVSIFKNNGTGVFAAAVNYTVGDAPTSIHAVDLDGDGDADVVTANTSGANASILKNNGDGTFSTVVNYSVGPGPNAVYAADLDGDGDRDLAVAVGNSVSAYVLDNNGDGTFDAPVQYRTGTTPSGVYAADLDGDSDLDLAVANSASANVSVLINTGPPPSGERQPADIFPSELEVSILPDRCTTDRKVQLLLHAHDTAFVRISNLPDLSDGEWRPFEPGTDRTQTFDWTLSEGDGEKTVYIVFKGPYFDLVSPIQTATISLDQATLCHTPQEHAHIVDLEGHVMSAQTNPLCMSDYAHATIEPYIVTSDGSTRGWRDFFVRTSSTSDLVTTYGFEAGNDFSYNDVMVRVERQGRTASIHLDPITDSNVSEVKLRVDAADRGMLEERLLWSRGFEPLPEPETVDLGKYQELCEADFIPHPHAGNLFKIPSSGVYYMGSDRKRHAFPNQDIFRSWYSVETPVLTIASYQLAAIPLGENVTLKPGSLARIVGETGIYVVDVGAVLRAILWDSLLSILRTPPLSELVHSLNAALFENYSLGIPIASLSEPIPSTEGIATTIDDLWLGGEGDEHVESAYPLSVFDGRVEFEGTPYPTGDVPIRFRIYDKNGRALTAEDLNVAHDKRMHLIIVRDDLSDFQHIHPEERDGVWTVNAQFPQSGHYAVYIDIAPTGGLHLVLRASLAVGEDPQHGIGFPEPDSTRAFFENPFRLELMTQRIVAGEDLELTFQLTKDGKPFEGIEQYLNAYGHLVVLNQQNANVYLHSHPDQVPVNGEITFTARFPYPGRYTLFTQLNAEGAIHKFPITLDVMGP
ncbi:VCBS repeat-containing protein [Patescibacteria group bacterium]|jgi:hypothetical protein|nr:VCBS repeat-containing protein [Patescibacteria group bacterium]